LQTQQLEGEKECPKRHEARNLNERTLTKQKNDEQLVTQVTQETIKTKAEKARFSTKKTKMKGFCTIYTFTM
jgi:hypothetical protein